MPLASPGAPYVQKDGQIVAAPDTQEKLASGELTVGAPIARSYSPKKRRSFKDLPTDPKTQTAIIVIMVYSLLGLTENEIAHIIGIDLEKVEALRRHSAYQETFELLFFELISANSNSLQSKIASMAPTALESLLEVMQKGKQEVARVRAADSVLDRAGLRADELFGQQSSGMESLNIVFQDGDENKVSVDINVKGK